jgi:hypothetical protein
VTGRRPPSRSHIPAIMPAYSFVHPLRPPAVANASAQEQIAPAKPEEDEPPPRPLTSTQDEISVQGKPSKEPLLPFPPVILETLLNPVDETTTRQETLNQPTLQEDTLNNVNATRTRNWQHFPGKTKYHFNGRLQFGTQYLANFATASLILIPTGLYFAFTYFPSLQN